MNNKMRTGLLSVFMIIAVAILSLSGCNTVHAKDEKSGQMPAFLYSMPLDYASQFSVDYYENGYNAFRQEDYVTALENFKKAIEYNSENVEAHYYLACTYLCFAGNHHFR